MPKNSCGLHHSEKYSDPVGSSLTNEPHRTIAAGLQVGCLHARFPVCSTSSETDSSTKSLKVWVTAVTLTRKQPAFLHKEPFGTTGSRAKYLGALKCLATSVRKNNKPSRGEGIEAAEL